METYVERDVGRSLGFLLTDETIKYHVEVEILKPKLSKTQFTYEAKFFLTDSILGNQNLLIITLC